VATPRGIGGVVFNEPEEKISPSAMAGENSL